MPILPILQMWAIKLTVFITFMTTWRTINTIHHITAPVVRDNVFEMIE